MVSKNPASKRDYQREDKREDTSTEVKHREERNLARAHETKRLGHKPAGDVAHITPLKGGGSSSPSNLRVETVARNRGWRGGQKGYKVPKDV
jgi:hypothetical protein